MAKTSNGPPAILVAIYPSISNPGGKAHEVRISRTDGKMYCQCQGWRFKKRCRHTEAVTKYDILNALEEAGSTGVLGI